MPSQPRSLRLSYRAILAAISAFVLLPNRASAEPVTPPDTQNASIVIIDPTTTSSSSAHPVALISGLNAQEVVVDPYLWSSALMLKVVESTDERFKQLPQPLQDRLSTDWNRIVKVRAMDPKDSGTVLIELTGIDNLKDRKQVSEMLVHMFLRQLHDQRIAVAHERAETLNTLRNRGQTNLQQIEGEVKDAMNHLAARGSAVDNAYRDAWVRANLEVAQLKSRLAVQQQVIDQNLPNLRVGTPVPAALTAMLGQSVIQPKDENERNVIQFSLNAAMEKLRIEIAVSQRNADESAKRYDSAKLDAADISLETRALQQRLADEDAVANFIRNINGQLEQLDDQTITSGVTATRLE